MANQKNKKRPKKVKKFNKIYIKPNGKTSVQVTAAKYPILFRIIKENWNMYAKDYQDATKHLKDDEYVTIPDLPTYMIKEEDYKVLQEEVKTEDFQIILYMNDSVTTWVVLRVKRKISIFKRIQMWVNNTWAKMSKKAAKGGNVYMEK